jgi:hypothetical protein
MPVIPVPLQQGYILIHDQAKPLTYLDKTVAIMAIKTSPIFKAAGWRIILPILIPLVTLRVVAFGVYLAVYSDIAIILANIDSIFRWFSGN